MKRFVLSLGMILGAALVPSLSHAEIAIQQVQSPGGFDAWLVEEHAIPFVALELRFKGGASLDVAGKRGATNLMTGLLEEGAAGMDARAFAEAKEAIAAQIDYGSDDDTLRISAQFLTETRDKGVDLLRASIIEPLFDADSVERVRKQVISGLQSDVTDPDEIVSRAFDQMVYGDHPYATNHAGTIESVSALTREDVVQAWKNAIAKDRVVISAAGDITAQELGALMDKLLSDLPDTGAAQPARVDVQTTAGVTVVPFDTPQSVAIFGHRGMKRNDPDFFAAYILNTIFGEGGFESRLMHEVREKRGLTYGVYSYLMPRDHAELVIGRVASGNDRMAEAIDVIKAEWAKVAKDGVTADELADAKIYLTGSYPLRFDGNGPIAKILIGMQMDDLSPDYITTRNAKIEAVTLEDIRRVAGELMKPDELAFVVVGQPEGLDGDAVGQ